MIVPDQHVLFIMIFYSAAIGAILGVIYDIFRIIRIAVQISDKKNTNKTEKSAKLREIISFTVIFIEDILFFIIAAIITILFIFMINNGQVRLFAITGEILGFILYYFTIGRVVKALAEKIIAFIKLVLSLIKKHIILPPIRLVIFIIKKIVLAVRKVFLHFKAVRIQKKLRAYTKKEMTRFIKLAESGYGLRIE